jgi:hypothetical protein
MSGPCPVDRVAPGSTATMAIGSMAVIGPKCSSMKANAAHRGQRKLRRAHRCRRTDARKVPGDVPELRVKALVDE